MSGPTVFWDVDTQFDFLSPNGALYVPEAETLIPNLQRLTRRAHDLSIPIIADSDDHEWTDAEISANPDFKTTFPPHCMRGTPGAERIPETRQSWTLVAGHQRLSLQEIRVGLDRPQARVLILKKTLDVFLNPKTEAILEFLRPESVVVYGVALDFCNRMVIEGLLARGQCHIVAVTDATKPIYADGTRAMLAQWEAHGVRLRTTQEVLREVGSTLEAPMAILQR